VEGGITLPVVTPITTPDRVGNLIEALAPASERPARVGVG
jgi:hypothetical protein